MREQFEMLLLLFALLAQSFVDFVKVALTDERDYVPGFGTAAIIRWRFSAAICSSRWRSERLMKKSGVGILIVVDAPPV
jgi:hypothetical protein